MRSQKVLSASDLTFEYCKWGSIYAQSKSTDFCEKYVSLRGPLRKHSRFTGRGVDAQISTVDKVMYVLLLCISRGGIYENFIGQSVSNFHTTTVSNFTFFPLLQPPRFLHLLLLSVVPRETFSCSAFLGLIPSSSQHSSRLATYEQRLPCQCTGGRRDHYFDCITNGWKTNINVGRVAVFLSSLINCTTGPYKSLNRCCQVFRW